MSQRSLLTLGLAAIASGLLIGVVGMATSGGASMMGWHWGAGGQSISMDQAQRSVESFISGTGDADLTLDELMEFDQNFYALIKEKSTGIGAFELLIDRSSGRAGFEPGPNMMWNTKYSTMGGMMSGGMVGGGGFRLAPSSASMPIDPDQATRAAQDWLDQHLSGDSAGSADRFYGYYTFHFEKNGRIAGMLSVNGYGGEVWFHSWHGTFIDSRDFGAAAS